MSMWLIVWPVLFLLPDEFDFSGWRGYAVGTLTVIYVVVAVVYFWGTILKRVDDAQRSRILWIPGMFIPVIQFFLLVRLGLIKAPDDESVLATRDKIIVGLWIAVFTLAYWSVQVTLGVISSANAPAG